ncbi:hypothetical protein CC1G_11425 [Coprinopsis cinerea okayama7|uniref:F-box domain-containing protein n=1 Tax=Coprinopsis cinerea (strain Okayama-7 / 130 / ATCC MYA-4618 / FGSC 9003) TaxID=240176 RepID=A8N494_COPC7|nr:hypothetical protein CC1G_11425 [Coprinopsis cinerea okayama7\|eukprot:XP_001829689.2 hypothetical protein CC1G_11425 [Coprinopsis cinerea okayama7\
MSCSIFLSKWAWKAATPNDIEYLPGRNENSPLTIDQVCKAWRQLCRGNSRLYSDIHVVNPTQQDVARTIACLSGSQRILHYIFRRRRQAATADESANTDCLFPWHRILKLVFANAHRVEKLYLQIPIGPKEEGWDYTLTLRRHIDWDGLAFPLLTTLHFHDEVSLYMSEDSFFKPLVTRACATSTRLTDMRLDPTFAFVHIIGVDPLNRLRPCASIIPWKYLTSLTIAIHHVKEMLPILRQCPLLQELYLKSDICWSSTREEPVGEPVFLPSLWCLVLFVDGSNRNTFAPLLYLKVPALKSLSLQTPIERDLFPDLNAPRKSSHLFGALTVFHRLNPECRIQTFSSFQKWDLRDHGYRQILSLPIFDDLISFKTHDTIGDEILEWMTWDRTSDDPQVLPKLQTFSAHVHAKDGVVSRMVASRVLDVPTPVLRKVRAVFIQGPKRESEWETRLRPSMEWIGYSVR